MGCCAAWAWSRAAAPGLVTTANVGGAASSSRARVGGHAASWSPAEVGDVGSSWRATEAAERRAVATDATGPAVAHGVLGSVVAPAVGVVVPEVPALATHPEVGDDELATPGAPDLESVDSGAPVGTEALVVGAVATLRCGAASHGGEGTGRAGSTAGRLLSRRAGPRRRQRARSPGRRHAWVDAGLRLTGRERARRRQVGTAGPQRSKHSHRRSLPAPRRRRAAAPGQRTWAPADRWAELHRRQRRRREQHEGGQQDHSSHQGQPARARTCQGATRITASSRARVRPRRRHRWARTTAGARRPRPA